MQIKIDDRVIFEITPALQEIIAYSIPRASLLEDVEYRLAYIISEKVKGCKRRMQEDWLPILREELSSLPTKEDDIIALIMARPDYKDREAREAANAQMA